MTCASTEGLHFVAVSVDRQIESILFFLPFTRLNTHRLHNKMTTDYKFKGWGAFDKNCVSDGGFKEFEYEPKGWAEDDVDSELALSSLSLLVSLLLLCQGCTGAGCGCSSLPEADHLLAVHSQDREACRATVDIATQLLTLPYRPVRSMPPSVDVLR